MLFFLFRFHHRNLYIARVVRVMIQGDKRGPGILSGFFSNLWKPMKGPDSQQNPLFITMDVASNHYYFRMSQRVK